MGNRTSHLTDTDLIQMTDGELPEDTAAEVRNHLSACWTCRERSRTLEETITGFIRERNAALQNALPSAAGPRALLRARMEQFSTQAEVPSRKPIGKLRIANAWISKARPGLRRLLTAAACLGVLAVTLAVFEFSVNAEGPRPNSAFTPGETRPITLAEVCSNPRAEVVVRHISLETQRQVLASYGLKRVRPGEFEVDYLITPDLGGAETPRNLWPQPYSARWNAAVKDELEQRLHDLVCAGKIDLQTAQRDIARDWIGAYRKYVDRE